MNMEDYKTQPLDLNQQERVLGWERGIKLAMQSNGLEGRSVTESIANQRASNMENLEVHKRILERYTPYVRDYDENVAQINHWANEGRRTNSEQDWAMYDDYLQRLAVPDQCEDIHNNWMGLGNEYRKIEELQKKEERYKRDEQTEIQAVGKVMQVIISTTSRELYRKYGMILDQPEGDRVKRLTQVITIVKDAIAGAISVQKARWRRMVDKVPTANTMTELEALLDNIQYIKTSVESEEEAYPGSNPYVSTDWKIILESKIVAEGDMLMVYSNILNMGEAETLEVICKKLKVTIMDKYKRKREQEPKSDIKDGLQVLAARMDTIEKDRDRGRDRDQSRRDDRDRSHDRGRFANRGDGQYDRGRGEERGRGGDRYERGRGGERGRSTERYDRGRGEYGYNKEKERGRSRERREGNSYQASKCYEYEDKGKCTYEARTGYKCKFAHKKEGDSDSDSGGSTDGRALKRKK